MSNQSPHGEPRTGSSGSPRVSSERAQNWAIGQTMTKPHRPRGNYVVGPDGSPLTIADLPPQGIKRWVPYRKAEVVAAVRGGLLSLQEACSRRSWQESIDQHGLRGLRTTRIQRYRPGHWRRAYGKNSLVAQQFRPPRGQIHRCRSILRAATPPVFFAMEAFRPDSG
jgi:hypothetical protein